MLYMLIEHVQKSFASVNEKVLYQLFFNHSMNEKKKLFHDNFVF